MHGGPWEPLLGRSHEICLPSRQPAALCLASDDWILNRFCWELRHASGGLRCAQGRHRISCQQKLSVPRKTIYGIYVYHVLVQAFARQLMMRRVIWGPTSFVFTVAVAAISY